MIIYIAHPLEGDGSEEWGNFERNLNRCIEIMQRAYDAGHTVLSWIHHVVLHALGLRVDWLSKDLELLSLLVGRQDACLWQCCPRGVSRGVDAEVAFAQEHGIPVVEVWRE